MISISNKTLSIILFIKNNLEKIKFDFEKKKKKNFINLWYFYFGKFYKLYLEINI